MLPVIPLPKQRVIENLGGFLKADPVLPYVESVLVLIPLKLPADYRPSHILLYRISRTCPDRAHPRPS